MSRDRRLLAAGLVLVALNLRTTVASLPPFALAIEHDARISAAAVGLLTSLPVLCMALLGAPAHRLAMRWGREKTMLIAIACVAGGNALRAAGDAPAALFAATLVAGIGIAACGVMLPGLVKHAFPQRAGGMTALCSAAMLLGAAVAGTLAVPLERLLGSWQASLATWGLPALAAALAWSSVAARDRAPVGPARPATSGLPWRAPAAWLLGAFFALQSTLGYAYLAWLPAAYEARGWSRAAAGGLVGVLHLAQLATAVTLPVLAHRSRDRRPALLGAVSLTVLATAWLVALPGELPWVATAIAGLGIGGGFSLTLLLIVDYAADADASSGLAAMTFMLGYAVAALAPLAVGALHDRFGGFGVPFAALALVALMQLAMATRLAPRHAGSVSTPR